MERKTQYIVRFSDCDPFNHLNNSRYMDYMLDAREDHLKLFYNFNLQEYYQKAVGWVVFSHEIIYVRPASYAEKVSIHSSLISLTHEHLLVEMIMMNENSSHIKAVLWTKFACINLKTQQRVNHTEEFMNFAGGMVDTEIDNGNGLANRLRDIKAKLEKTTAQNQ